VGDATDKADVGGDRLKCARAATGHANAGSLGGMCHGHGSAEGRLAPVTKVRLPTSGPEPGDP